MKRFSILFALALIFTAASIAHAQVTPPYIANNGADQTSTHPYITWQPKQWGSSNTRAKLKWRTDIGGSADVIIQNAWNLWDVLPGAPDYLGGTKTTGQQDVLIGDYDTCSVSDAYACWKVSSWSTDNTRKVWYVQSSLIDFQTWGDHTDAFRQIIMTHEIGHVLGLEDRYLVDSNGHVNCDTGPQTAMGAWDCGNHHDNPTGLDSDQLRNFYRFCDGVYSWCGKMQPNSIGVFSNGDFLTTWTNYAWGNHTGVVQYFRSTNGSSGPYYYFSQNNTVKDHVGFWNDGITYNNNNQNAGYVSTVNEGNARNKFGQGNWVYACSIPWAPAIASAGYVGLYKCSGIVQIP